MTGGAGQKEPGDTAPNDAVVVVTRVVAAPLQNVWRCLTAPDCFKVWWQEHLTFEPRLGGRFSAPFVDPSGKGRSVTAEVTAYQPPKGFVMVWADEGWDFDTVVSVSLEPVGTGTRVTIEHQGWEAAPEPDRSVFLLDHRAGWEHHLGRLASHAESHDHDADGADEGP
ncbi:SRPBCC domain-containing protein [Aurantimonas sp. VKM B-3413]|uniref:SRPBCC family protein n=1 Tax=Aurantimonas sp. VKM B-3413 TaxID=2779401 RepID=UPI001E301133|nr:SRPBCC domain-containing protein [Aurantimonas sp. VKM B-3413]MCB8838543.1 SRPBCC domain-containing protein [Aurantimonas sp. VKM B-3413]